MKLARLHSDEQRRLQSPRSFGLLNSGKKERFDRLIGLARSLYNLPVASISPVEEDLLHIKSCTGLGVDTVPRGISSRAHTILQTDPLIVDNIQQDECSRDNPLVIVALFIRFYAGYPVQLLDDATVESLCLMDHQLRSSPAHKMQILSDLAVIAEDEFKVLDMATSGKLTGLFNRREFLTLAECALLTAQRHHEPVSLAFVDLNRFKHINDTWGHRRGGRALIAIADLAKVASRESNILARQGGDEFIILFANTSRHGATIAVGTLSHNVARFNQQTAHLWQLAFSWGCVEYDPASHPSLNTLVAITDRLMYQAKQKQSREHH